MSQQPSVTKYEATIRLRANSHQELHELVRSLAGNWWHHHVAYGDRHEGNSTDGRTSVRLEHTNPEQTSEKYLAELRAWEPAWRPEEDSARALLDECVCRPGCPAQLHLDRCPEENR